MVVAASVVRLRLFVVGSEEEEDDADAARLTVVFFILAKKDTEKPDVQKGKETNNTNGVNFTMEQVPIAFVKTFCRCCCWTLKKKKIAFHCLTVCYLLEHRVHLHSDIVSTAAETKRVAS